MTTTEPETRATAFCDYHAPAVRDLAARLFADVTEPRAIATTGFRYVRDHIRFGLDLWQVTASATLRKGHGMCSNKALLWIALLRARGVPAQLAWVPMRREGLRPAWGAAQWAMPRVLNHVIGEVELDGRWLAVDLTLDPNTYDRLFAPAVRWTIDWDGTRDCLLFADNLAGPVVSCPDVDATLRRNAGNPAPPAALAGPLLALVNRRMWRKVDRG